jgi:hypothetical protein
MHADYPADDLLGDPDLLRYEGDRYVAGDIKSGAGEEGPEDVGTPKVHYAVQVALLYRYFGAQRSICGSRGMAHSRGVSVALKYKSAVRWNCAWATATATR